MWDILRRAVRRRWGRRGQATAEFAVAFMFFFFLIAALYFGGLAVLRAADTSLFTFNASTASAAFPGPAAAPEGLFRWPGAYQAFGSSCVRGAWADFRYVQSFPFLWGTIAEEVHRLGAFRRWWRFWAGPPPCRPWE